MVDQKKLFRKESLERLSSPERLDQLMEVIGPKDWLPLVTLGSLVVVGVVWSMVGRIPITVTGQGVLIRPSKVVVFQSPSNGQLLTINAKVGDAVKKGDVLATIDQPELRKQLQQQQVKLALLQGQERDATTLQGQRTDLEIRSIQQQRQSLQERILQTQALTPILKEKGIGALQRERIDILDRIRYEQALSPVLINKDKATIVQDRQNLQKRLQETKDLTPVLKQRWNSIKNLGEKQVITQDLVLQAQQEYLSSIARVADLESQLKQLDFKETSSEKAYRDALNNISSLKTQLKNIDVREVEAEKSYRENINSISTLQAQLRELDSKEKSLAQQNFESEIARKNQMQEVKQQIAQLELQLQNNSKISSDYDGRILEIAAVPGQIINAGSRVGSIQANDPSGKIVAVTYFPVHDGKKIKISDDKNGRQNMRIQVTPTTVQRERFGGILGTIKSISAFPITKESAATLVGNQDIVQSIMAQGAYIETISELDADPANQSGYKWSSSKGPEDFKITEGTTTTARVTVEERAPITFLFPLLKSTTGLD